MNPTATLAPCCVHAMEIYKQILNTDIFMVIAALLLSPLDKIIHIIFQITYSVAAITSYISSGFGVVYYL
jgi:hypothetical protein